MTTTQTVYKKPCGHVVKGYHQFTKQRQERTSKALCHQCSRERDDRIISDPKVTRYLTVIQSKPKSGNQLSIHTRHQIGVSLHLFTRYMETNSPSELLDLHIKTRDQHLIEDKLEEFAQTKLSNRTRAQFIRGFFRANRNPLNVYIDNHTVDRQPPPSEERLKHIYQHGTLDQKALMSLQADSGERIRATALTKVEHLPDLNQQQDIHVIVFDQERTKIHRQHLSYYSENTAELIRQYVQDNSITSSDPLFPDYHNIWNPITTYSKSLGTYLISHHLRKRFVHIAERTPIAIADINYMMGDAKQGVHCAEAYSYTVEDELANEYRKCLLDLLPIGKNGHTETTDNHQNQNLDRVQQLENELRRANATIDNLNASLALQLQKNLERRS